MTHAVGKLIDEILKSGCPVFSFDLATDILLSIAVPYLDNNHSLFQTSNIRYFSVTCHPDDRVEYLSIRIECDDNRTYEVVYDRERLKSYRRDIK